MVKEGIRSLVRLFVSQIWKPFKMWRRWKGPHTSHAALVLPNGFRVYIQFLLFNDKHANDGSVSKVERHEWYYQRRGYILNLFFFYLEKFFFSLLDIENGRNKNKPLFLEREICFLCASEKLCDFGFGMDTDRYTLPEVGIHVCVMIHEDKANFRF